MDPHQPIGKFLHSLTYKMYDHAKKTHEFAQRRKLSWKRKHPEPVLPSSASTSSLGRGSDGNSVHGPESSDSSGCCSTAMGEHAHGRHEPGEHPLDALDFVNHSEPQLGAQHRVVSTPVHRSEVAG